MLSFEECLKIAESKAQRNNTKINKTYEIKNDYAFESVDEVVGVFPTVVIAKSGETVPLWNYLNNNELSYDDLR